MAGPNILPIIPRHVYADLSHEDCSLRSKFGLSAALFGLALLAMGIGATRGTHSWAKGAATLPLFGGALLMLGGTFTYMFWDPVTALERCDRQRMAEEHRLRTPANQLWLSELAYMGNALNDVTQSGSSRQRAAVFEYEMERIGLLLDEQPRPPTGSTRTWNSWMQAVGIHCAQRSAQRAYAALATARWPQMGVKRCRQELLMAERLAQHLPDDGARAFHTRRLAHLYEHAAGQGGQVAARVAMLCHAVAYAPLRDQLTGQAVPGIATGTWQALRARAMHSRGNGTTTFVVLREMDTLEAVLREQSWQINPLVATAGRWHSCVSLGSMWPIANTPADLQIAPVMARWTAEATAEEAGRSVNELYRVVFNAWRQLPDWNRPGAMVRGVQCIAAWIEAIPSGPARIALIESALNENLAIRMNEWMADPALRPTVQAAATQLANAAQGLELSNQRAVDQLARLVKRRS